MAGSQLITKEFRSLWWRSWNFRQFGYAALILCGAAFLRLLYYPTSSFALTIIGLLLLARLAVKYLGGPDQIAAEQTAHQNAISRAHAADQERSSAARLHPPIWPPRKPDDWGQLEQEKFRVEQKRHGQWAARSVGGWTPPPPVAPVIPSWEDWHRLQQQDDERQIRWAQSETGEWVRIVWGNSARLPADGGPLPVFQAMKNEASGVWTWIKLGRNVSLGWQSGPQRMERIRLKSGNVYIRPCGSPGHQDAPPPIKPDGSRGSSDWGTLDDLRNLGAVR